ncbi:hypothetical protein Y1Q_0016762 [Alligator mississippiensis]|uniref:Uncharacterized protein n=1 Tax=Alligator mississippiensis TaxID=8496 RepID=A0A151P660_ALLMI|nr:hypothetical protein Y1Q_0016762 [Alligator mississippiensis]
MPVKQRMMPPPNHWLPWQKAKRTVRMTTGEAEKMTDEPPRRDEKHLSPTSRKSTPKEKQQTGNGPGIWEKKKTSMKQELK